MSVLTPEMQKVVAEQKLGFIATVGADGVPNLSPKGTFLVLDADRLMFAEMRSPNTVVNIAGNPQVEINFVDVFSRAGLRAKGKARFVAAGTAEYADLYPPFEAQWGPDFGALFNGIVVIDLQSAAEVKSPAYDLGATEEQLRETYFAYFKELNGK